MIRLDQISKQHGPQILFVEASAAIYRGEKVGLVGPNGAGKSTVFRMIMKEESPDEGQISLDRGITIGYFSQDVGEMTGQPAVAEVMAGAGQVSEVAAELKQLEEALADPARADDLDRLLARFGEVQARFDELGGYALEARAREILAGLGFSGEMMDGDVGKLSGGWKMRVALARILLMRPDAMLLDEPSNHLDLESLIWLEGFLKAYEGALILTSHDREFMNRIVTRIIEIDGGVLTSYSGNYDFYEKQRELQEAQAEAAYQRQQAMLAKEMRFIERFKAQAAKAAQVQSRVKKLDKIDKVEPPKRRKTLTFEFPACPRSGEDVIKLARVDKRYGTRVIYQGLDLHDPPPGALGHHGGQRRGQVHLAQARGGRDRAGRRRGQPGRQREARLLRPALDGAALARPDGHRRPWRRPSPWPTWARCARWPAVSASPATTSRRAAACSRAGRRRAWSWPASSTTSPNFLVLDEPTNHLDMGTKEMIVRALGDYDGTMLFVSHDRKFLAQLSNRVLELTPEGPIVYGGGYLEYVARSGHEAPGLH